MLNNMTEEKKEVFIIYESRELSCNTDYDYDGFIIVWDSEEVGRNMTASELIKEVERQDDEVIDKLEKHIHEEKGVDIRNQEDIDMYFDDVYDFLEKELGDSGFYKYEYQTVQFVKEVHATEESAKSQVEYYNNNHAYRKHKYSYVRHTVYERSK